MEGEWLSRALKEVEQVVEFDHALDNIRDQLYDADSILEDAKREISSYMSSVEFDEETFRQTEERLDLIHNLQAKYGATISKINQKLEEKGNVWTNWRIMIITGNRQRRNWINAGII